MSQIIKQQGEIIKLLSVLVSNSHQVNPQPLLTPYQQSTTPLLASIASHFPGIPLQQPNITQPRLQQPNTTSLHQPMLLQSNVATPIQQQQSDLQQLSTLPQPPNANSKPRFQQLNATSLQLPDLPQPSLQQQQPELQLPNVTLQQPNITFQQSNNQQPNVTSLQSYIQQPKATSFQCNLQPNAISLQQPSLQYQPSMKVMPNLQRHHEVMPNLQQHHDSTSRENAQQPCDEMILDKTLEMSPYSEQTNIDIFSDDYSWESDSDYLTSSTTTCEPFSSRSRDTTPHSSFLGKRDHTSTCNVLSSTESAVTPPPTTLMISGINETQLQPKSKNIPPPPFSTPPKLKSVEQVMSDVPGSDVASLRLLTTALARNAIFGREHLAKSSLSGRKNTSCLDQEKLDYIKTLVHSRANTKSEVEFEFIWSQCRNSLSKSCQTLRNAKRKL